MTARDPQVSDFVGLTSEGRASEPAARPEEESVRYRLGGELGVGGMGRVRAAFDTRLEREIAIKHVRAEGDAAAEAALLREARVTAGLDHPGIIAVLDAGTDEHGAPFYAMRVVHGDSLESIVATAPDPDARRGLARALLQAAQAIAYAHARGVVHRDLSPRNIRIGRHGEVVVMDWGLAAPIDEAARGGVVCGTPGFRAPELARGEAAGPPADVWSLGALLHLIVAGVPPDDRRHRVPATLRALLARALASSAAARYADAGAFARDLAAFLDGGRVEAHRERLWDRAARVARRHPGTVLASTTGIAAVAVVAIVLGTLAARRRDEAQRSQAEARDALRALVVPRASEATRAGRRSDAEQLARSARALGDPAAARGVEAAFAASARITTRLLGGEDGCRTLDVREGGVRLCTRGSELWLVDGPARHRIDAGTVEPYAARFLPDGGLLVVSDRAYRFAADRRLVATHALTGGLPQVDVSDGWAFVAVPDMYLAIAPDGTARTRTPCPSGIAIRLVAALPGTQGESVALCADGALVGDRLPRTHVQASALFVALPAPSAATVVAGALVLGGADGRIGLVELETGRVHHAALGPLGPITRIEPTPWGDAIVVGSEGVGLWRPASGAWRHIVPRADAADATATAAAEVIAFGAGTLHAWARARGEAVHEVHAAGGLSAIAWSPSGAWVAFGGGDGVVHLVGAKTGEVVRKPLAKQVIKSLAFSPDGAALALGIADDAGVLEVSASTLAPRAPLDVERAMRARRIAYLTADLLVAFTYHAQPSAYDRGSGHRVPIAQLSDAIVDIATPSRPGTIFALDARGALWRYGARGQHGLRPVPRGVAIATSADGRTLAAITSKGALEVRDAETDATRATLAMPGADVVALALSPTGDRVAVGRLDGAVEIWSVSPARRELALHAHAGRVAAVAFAPDGCTLATAGWDAVGRLLALCDQDAQRASSVQPVPAASQAARGASTVAWSQPVLGALDSSSVITDGESWW
ncbi:MAG: protein kinase [Kofleriaceae bacterium]|nr:protein kinase [Kofleriaceae bacterium]